MSHNKRPSQEPTTILVPVSAASNQKKRPSEERPTPPPATDELNTRMKRARRCLTIEDKIKLLDRLRAGERPAHLSRKCNISESSLRALLRCEAHVREYAARCTPNAYRTAAYVPRDFMLERTEQLLHVWVEQERAAGRVQTATSICAKAREMYAELRDASCSNAGEKTASADLVDDDNDTAQLDDVREFKASKGWFNKFRRRYKLDFPPSSEPALLDTTAADRYAATFAKQAKLCGYKPQQVFSASKISLAWKRLPARTYIAQQDQLQHAIGNDRVNLLFCGNAMGDFYVKPLLVYRTPSPFCMRVTNHADLPVFWRALAKYEESNAGVTPAHFHDWLTQCFVPMVRHYLQIIEQPQRCMLLLDEELVSPAQLPAYADDFVRLEFLPPHTTQLLQPLTQSVIPQFKCVYLRRFLAYLLNGTHGASQQSLYHVWCDYAISEAIENIQEALNELSSNCWNAGWQRLWAKIVREPFRRSVLTYEMQRIVDVGCNLTGVGFTDMTIDDVKEHLKLESIAEDDTELSYVNDYANWHSVDETSAQQQHADTQAAANYTDYNLIEIKTENDTFSEQAADQSQNYSTIHADDKQQNKRTQVQSINKAMCLTQELISTLAELQTPTKEEHTKFANDLQKLMQPYVELKQRLLQPSIREYFK